MSEIKIICTCGVPNNRVRVTMEKDSIVLECLECGAMVRKKSVGEKGQ